MNFSRAHEQNEDIISMNQDTRGGGSVSPIEARGLTKRFGRVTAGLDTKTKGHRHSSRCP